MEEREVLDQIRETKVKLVKLRAELQSLRKNRDELNDTVRALKKTRDELRDSARKSISSLRELRKRGVRTTEGVQAEHEMAQLEWTIQTSPLAKEEEKRLMGKVKTLETRVGSYRRVQSLSKKVDKDREEADALHAKIQEIAQASQAHHEEIIALGDRFQGLREKLEEHERKLGEIRGRVREVNQKYVSTMTMTRQADRISQTHRERAHRDSLKASAKKKLSEGGKLSLHELGALLEDEEKADKEE